jgi:nucleoid DNA-binding protein
MNYNKNNIFVNISPILKNSIYCKGLLGRPLKRLIAKGSRALSYNRISISALKEVPISSPMNKVQLAEMIHEKIGGTKVQSEEVVQMIIDSIVSTLKKGGEVSLAGLGIFSVKARPARMARNPKTGEQVKVAATTVPKFRAAKALKDAVK